MAGAVFRSVLFCQLISVRVRIRSFSSVVLSSVGATTVRVDCESVAIVGLDRGEGLASKIHVNEC